MTAERKAALSGELRQRWLALSADLSLCEAPIAAYSEPDRRYHGLGHIAWLLEERKRSARR